LDEAAGDPNALRNNALTIKMENSATLNFIDTPFSNMEFLEEILCSVLYNEEYPGMLLGY
jgi:hypothetical protein